MITIFFTLALASRCLDGSSAQLGATPSTRRKVVVGYSYPKRGITIERWSRLALLFLVRSTPARLPVAVAAALALSASSAPSGVADVETSHVSSPCMISIACLATFG